MQENEFSTFSGNDAECFAETTFPAVLNNCSEGTDVATTQRCLCISLGIYADRQPTNAMGIDPQQ